MKEMKTTAQVLVDCLEAEGVDVMFGIPGEETLDLMFAIRDSKIRFIPVRHEQGAAFMADVYGRLTGRAGVCLSTLGHHGVDHWDVQTVGQLGDSCGGMAAHSACTCKNDRIFRLTDNFSCRCNVGRVGIDLMHLLALERHSVGGHFGDILGQVDMGRARLALFGVLEGQPHDLAHRIGADDLL